jgi:hypothetical protein
MTTTLWPNLIFEKHSPSAGANEIFNSSNHIDGIAVARVGIDDHRLVDHRTNSLSGADNFRLGKQAEVRLTEEGGGKAVAGYEDDFKSSTRGNLCAQGVINTGHDQLTMLRQATPYELRIRHNISLSLPILIFLAHARSHYAAG